jgi:hypothetical protein
MNIIRDILLLNLVWLVKGVVLQNNNCANYFKYVRDNGQIKGQIEIRNPPIAPLIFLKIKLQFNTRLTSVSFF